MSQYARSKINIRYQRPSAQLLAGREKGNRFHNFILSPHGKFKIKLLPLGYTAEMEE